MEHLTRHDPTPSPRPAPAVHRVLLADDDDDLRSYLASVLRLRGYQVSEAVNGVELLGRVERAFTDDLVEGFFDAVVTDVRMPGVTGTSVLHGLAAVGLAARVVVISGFADSETVGLARRLGAAAVLAKPFETAAFLRAIDTAMGGAEPALAPTPQATEPRGRASVLPLRARRR